MATVQMWRGTAWHSPAQPGTARHSPAQPSKAGTAKVCLGRACGVGGTIYTGLTWKMQSKAGTQEVDKSKVCAE